MACGSLQFGSYSRSSEAITVELTEKMNAEIRTSRDEPLEPLHRPEVQVQLPVGSGPGHTDLSVAMRDMQQP